MANSLIRIFARLLNLVPRPALLPLVRVLATAIYVLVPHRRDVALANIQKALPTLSLARQKAILRGAYRHFLVAMAEFIRIPQVKTARLDHLVQLDHDLLDDLVARQQGAIFVTGHFGNWEMINLTLGRLGYPLVGVAVKQKGAGGRYVEWVREQTGARFIDRKASTREMLRLIKSGHFLGLVNDQDALRHGVRIEFFGQPSSRFKGAAMFALQTGLPVVFGACLMGPGNRYKITFAPISTDNLPDDRDEAIRELTQRINSQLEMAIKDHPEQYFWFHRMWKSQLQ